MTITRCQLELVIYFPLDDIPRYLSLEIYPRALDRAQGECSLYGGEDFSNRVAELSARATAR